MRVLFLFLCLSVATAGCGGKAVIDAEPTGTSSNTSSSAAGGGTMGGGDIRSIELDEAIAFADCFPGSPGGLDVAFSMTFESESATATFVEVIGAKLQGTAGVTNFVVDPASFILEPGATRTFDFDKTGPGSGTAACDWCEPTNTELVVDFLVEGAPRSVTDAIDSVSCAF